MTAPDCVSNKFPSITKSVGAGSVVRLRREEPPTSVSAPNTWGISIFYRGGGAVYNNTVSNNDIRIYVCCDAQTSTIDNNIVYNNSGVGLYVADSSVGVMTLRNNLSARNAGENFKDDFGRAVLSGNFIGDQYDPKFANAAANDFRLLVGSQAIDTGRVITGLTTDSLGIARPRGAGYDIGAYEY